jgi:hypothetical protein
MTINIARLPAVSISSVVIALALPGTAEQKRIGRGVARVAEWTASEGSPDAPTLLPPWSATSLPPWARSVRVREGEQSLFEEPGHDSKRRGSAVEGALLPLYGARSGPGCRAPWLHVGAHAWLCADQADASAAAPLGVDSPVAVARDDGLPFRYFFAGPSGALAYRRLAEFDVGQPAFELEQGFAVAVVAERVVRGERYGLTRRGLWVRLSDFGAARPPSFDGAELDGTAATISVAWVVVDRAPLYRKNGLSFVPTGQAKARFDRVAWLEQSKSFSGDYARIDDRDWIRASDVRHPTIAPAPNEPDVAAGATWIDVELASQTLVAYRNGRPFFATIVSTGRGKQGSALETPVGVHRIWVKLVGTTMDNLENESAASYYRIEDVPYVQYFAKGVGLHAAFWHKSFGHTKSHGCVNLAPRDAARLFGVTSPRVHAGWSAALPTRYEQGTVIRVR